MAKKGSTRRVAPILFTHGLVGLHNCVPASYCSAMNHRKLGRGSPAYHKSRCCTSLFKDLILHIHYKSMIKTSQLNSNSVDLSFQPPHRMSHHEKFTVSTHQKGIIPEICKTVLIFKKKREHGKSNPHSLHPQVGGLHNCVLASYCSVASHSKLSGGFSAREGLLTTAGLPFRAGTLCLKSLGEFHPVFWKNVNNLI